MLSLEKINSLISIVNVQEILILKLKLSDIDKAYLFANGIYTYSVNLFAEFDYLNYNSNVYIFCKFPLKRINFYF